MCAIVSAFHLASTKADQAHFAVRVAIEYADQNEAFSPLLPRAGTVIEHLSDKQGNAGWLLVDLDDAFDYQVKLGEPLRFRGTTVTHFLVRSRQKGADVGGGEPVSVFVLLVEQNMLPIEGRIEPHDYIHACWGTCRVLGGA